MSKFIYSLVIFSLLITITVILVGYFQNVILVPRPPVPVLETLKPLATQTKLDDKATKPEDVTTVSNAISTFSSSFLNTLINSDTKYNQTENIFYSPYSITSAFYMVYEGANGNTAKQISKAFALDDVTIQELRKGYAKIYNSANTSKDYTLRTANALWPQETYKFLDTYTSTLKNSYAGESFPLNFKTKRQEAVKKINDWVILKTENKIQKILEDVDPTTKLVLTNAVYFKGDWIKAFDKKLTQKDKFTNADKTTSSVDMMNFDENPSVKYYEDNVLKAIALPYKGDSLSMFILLPNENNISSADAYLVPKKFQKLIAEMKTEETSVKMPKVKMEKDYDLTLVLKKMGVTDLFGGSSDLSKMDGTKMLFVSQAIHKTYVDIYEEGTEAAAVTAIVVANKSAMPTDTKTFFVDHPFVFVIYDKTTQTMLFVGRVVKL